MRESVSVKLPKYTPRITVHENIKKILGDKTLSSFQITRQMSNKSKSNIRSVMANMVREGELECNNCSHCDVGKTYKVKK